MTRFTVSVPTYNRPDELAACLESVIAQSRLPDEVFLVDDAELSTAYVERWRSRFAEKRVAFVYRRKDHRVERRGVSESKNIALKDASGDVVFFFDDDVVLEPGFIAAIAAVWEAAADETLMGVGGLIKNARRKSRAEKLYNAVFGLTGECAWDVTDTGFTVWDEGIAETQKGYYVHGGVSSYRRAAAAEQGFAVFTGGRAALEDLDFCLTAKTRGFHFILVPAAKALHNHSDTSYEGEYMVGFKDSANRRDIFRRLGPKGFAGRLRYWRASLGWFLRMLPARRWRRAAGMAAGFFS